jgi:glutathione S-transferase
VRLALEAAGADYIDVARGAQADGLGVPALRALLREAGGFNPQFAPPFLKDGRLLIGQTAAILLHLGERHRLAPKSTAGRLWTQQIQLTITDLVDEAHDVHHPVSSALYYEDQKVAAAQRATDFRQRRIPKYVGWFERILSGKTKAKHRLVGARLTYADLSLFQAVDGLRYAFPRAMKRILKGAPQVAAHHRATAERPRIVAYLASERRLPFNENGVFRHYPELDA